MVLLSDQREFVDQNWVLSAFSGGHNLEVFIHFSFWPGKGPSDQDEITEFRMHKMRALLVYLAADPEHTHRRETLMNLLWPGMPETSARANLRQVLFHLRQALARSSDGQIAAVGLADVIEIKDLQTGEILANLPVPEDALVADPDDVNSSAIPPTVSVLAIRPAGDRLLSAISTNVDGAIILWDLASGEELRRFEGHSAWIHDVVFSPDGEQFLSVSDDKTLIQWDVDSGEIVQQFSSASDAISSAVFSPDGTIIAGGFGTYRYPAGGGDLDHNIHLWDAATGEEIEQLQGHEGAVTALQFSPDGQTLLSGSTDETVRLWDVDSGAQVRRPGRISDGLACWDGRPAAPVSRPRGGRVLR